MTAREAFELVRAMVEDRRQSHERCLRHFDEKVRQLIISGDSAGAKAWDEDGERLRHYMREDEKVLARLQEIVRARLDAESAAADGVL